MCFLKKFLSFIILIRLLLVLTIVANVHCSRKIFKNVTLENYLKRHKKSLIELQFPNKFHSDVHVFSIVNDVKIEIMQLLEVV